MCVVKKRASKENLESQNRNFLELIKAMQTSKMTSHETKMISLLRFNPDCEGADASSWCSTVDMVLSENPLEGSALVIALSKSLEGSASHWLS